MSHSSWVRHLEKCVLMDILPPVVSDVGAGGDDDALRGSIGKRELRGGMWRLGLRMHTFSSQSNHAF